MLADNGFIVARAASYSASLAMFPGLVFVTALLFSRDANDALQELSTSMGHVLPRQVHQLLSDYLTVSPDRSAFVLTSAGLAAVLFASDLMATLMEGFRIAYRAPRRTSGWSDYGMAVALVFLSILPLAAANTALILSRQISTWLETLLGPLTWLADAAAPIGWAIAFAAFTGALAILYRVAPNRRQRWRHVFPGAALAALLWLPATAGFAIYVQRVARYREFYGSVSAMVVLLIWTYLASMIVLFGCEFNAARERRLGALKPRSLEEH
jgi:membrane protein